MYCVPDDYKCVNKTIVRTFVTVREPEILTKEPVESTKKPEEQPEKQPEEQPEKLSLTKEREEPEEQPEKLSLTKEPEEQPEEQPEKLPLTKEPEEPEYLPINVVTFINGKKVKDLKQYCQQLNLSYKNLRKQELQHLLCEYMIKQDNPSQCMASIDGSFMNH